MCNNNCCETSVMGCNNETYQEFVPDTEYAIGEFFKVDNEVFKVVRDATLGCKLCDFERCLACIKFEEQFILYDTLKENE